MTRMQELIRLPGVSIGTILATSVWLIFAGKRPRWRRRRKALEGHGGLRCQPADPVGHLRFRHRGDHPQIAENPVHQSGQVQLSRPDKLRATRTGGYRDVEIVFDGKMLTVSNKDGKDYAQIEVTGTAEELIDVLREKHGVVAPGADLLLTNVFNVMMTDVIEAAVIGKGVIDGVECDHLAFRNVETDWQIWIEAGAKPIPRKYVITSKGIAEAPQYTLRIKEWKTDVAGRRLRVQGRSIGQEDRARRNRRYRRGAAGHRQGRRQEMTRNAPICFVFRSRP